MASHWYNKELTILVGVWILIYAFDPLYMYYADMVSGFGFSWMKIFHLWGYTTSFLVMFLIHHFLLVPCVIKRKDRCVYGSGIVVCTIIFTLFLAFVAPKFDPYRELMHEPVENAQRHPRHKPGTDIQHKSEFNGHMPRKNGHKPRMDKHRPEEKNHKIPILTPTDFVRIAIVLMMFLIDFFAVALANDQKMRQRLLLLEKQTLKQELEHLRYQINPHFFMNTLNNIHALVDIDRERAQKAIIELSGLMRYSLYEGNDSMAPLQHEILFLKQYISLMMLRFGNKVTVTCDLPDSAPSESVLPPLLLATFVENAFKHGISYQYPSYITISLAVEDKKIQFRCENSRHQNASATQDGHHGIGLTNVRKRLDLQYNENYKLAINEETEKFTVELVLPA